MPLPEIKLTPREELYVDARLMGMNMRRAAIFAGCPEKGAHTQGWRMENKPAVQRELRRRRADLRRQNRASANAVMHELTYMALWRPSEEEELDPVRDENGVLRETKLPSLKVSPFVKLHALKQLKEHFYGRTAVAGNPNNRLAGAKDVTPQQKVVLYLPDNRGKTKNKK